MQMHSLITATNFSYKADTLHCLVQILLMVNIIHLVGTSGQHCHLWSTPSLLVNIVTTSQHRHSWSTSSRFVNIVHCITFGQHRHSWSQCLVNTFSLPVNISNRVFQTDPKTFNHKMNFSITLFNNSNNHKLNFYIPVYLIRSVV